MAVLCVLGPLAIIPFSIVRVGTGHLYLWAMGMISALYVGMPIIAGAIKKCCFMLARWDNDCCGQVVIRAEPGNKQNLGHHATQSDHQQT
jgi:hypothetical protein